MDMGSRGRPRALTDTGCSQPAALLDAPGPLVRLLREDYALQQFEALLALTNVSAAGPEARARVAGEAGIFDAVEELMWGGNARVRVAAAECLANIAVEPPVCASKVSGASSGMTSAGPSAIAGRSRLD